MVDCRKKIVFLFIIFCLHATFIYGQGQIYLRINDSNVRLRDEPGLNGKIIRQFAKNEIVEYINTVDLYDAWVNVKTSKETGWVYGEFLEYIAKNRLAINRIEDVGVVTPKGILLSGMDEKNIITFLGNPTESIYDKDEDVTTYCYGTQDEFRITAYKNDKIYHIRITSPEYELANGVKVGMNIKEITTLYDRKYETDTKNSYSYQVRNRLRNDRHEGFAIINTDLTGIITDIHIGFPAP